METPKPGWDTHDSFTDGQLDMADRFLAGKGTPLELEKDITVDDAQYIIPKPAQSTVEKPDSQAATADGILNGQEVAKVKNVGATNERLTFPPLEGREITINPETPEQMAANGNPFDKVGKNAFTKGPDRAPVAKPKAGFFSRIFGGQ